MGFRRYAVAGVAGLRVPGPAPGVGVYDMPKVWCLVMRVEERIYNPHARALELRLTLIFHDGELVGGRMSNLEHCPLRDYERALIYLEEQAPKSEQGQLLKVQFKTVLQVEREKRVFVTKSRKEKSNVN